MIPIQHLLNRIRWDREYGAGSFEIGYLDHVGQRIVRVSMRNITIERGDSFSFQLEDETGEVVTIPYHRIRQVYRNGAIIWERPV